MSRHGRAHQHDSESVASWGIHLETLLQKATDRGSRIDVHTRDSILRNRFWTGLVRDTLKNATRPAFHSGQGFEDLIQTVREIEHELQDRSLHVHKSKVKVIHQPKVTDPQQTSDSDSPYKIAQQLSEVIKKLDKLELRRQQPPPPPPPVENKILRQILDRLTVLEAQRALLLLTVFIQLEVELGGSMITSVSEAYYQSTLSDLERKSLTEIELDIMGAGDNLIPYTGYIEAPIYIPIYDVEYLIPVLITKDTEYNQRVPLCIGVNVIKRLKSDLQDTSKDVPDEWTTTLNSICHKGVLGTVKSTRNKPIAIQPNQMITITGL
ncbi:uncharacterized protein LOC124274556, partial [Haliotis rubra]|uniref:uncharacterized protein LOC124274556 n=1 Tax=Haliotis rubra TaxID=36100 RepID=UPI001EE57E8A